MYTDSMSFDLLEGLVDAAFSGSGDAVKVHLYSNVLAPTQTTPLSAFTELTQSWYSAIASTTGAAYKETDNSISVAVRSVQFNYSGSDAPVTVQGYFLTDTAGTNLISSRALDTPKTLASDDDSLVVAPVFNCKPTAQQ